MLRWRDAHSAWGETLYDRLDTGLDVMAHKNATSGDVLCGHARQKQLSYRLEIRRDHAEMDCDVVRVAGRRRRADIGAHACSGTAGAAAFHVTGTAGRYSCRIRRRFWFP